MKTAWKDAKGQLQGKIKPLVVAGDYSEAKMQEYYNRVKATVGDTGFEYIVDPSSSLIRSTQCVCLPGVISHLEMWKRVTTDARNCFDDAGTTGNIRSGMCRQFISNTVCEMIYEVISCFINKVGSPPTGAGGQRSGGGFLGINYFLGSMTDTQQTVSGRYGQTSMWNSLFNEKKFIHGMCMFAFTGTWDFDVGAAFSQGVAAQPVDSIVKMGPLCQRRFLGYSPITSPRGLTSWEHRLGQARGRVNTGRHLNEPAHILLAQTPQKHALEQSFPSQLPQGLR